ncbi:MAG TPA: hypothetical protein VEI95_18360, partial [Acidobacteriota bacterium]|nr:hypothetical protein [Acidobacteriota bacterium]
SVGMEYDVYFSASVDDVSEREVIMQLAVERAAERYGCVADAIYVGDGIWDARACRVLGIPFIGIGKAASAAKLRAEGAVEVLPDFSDSDWLLQILQSIKS